MHSGESTAGGSHHVGRSTGAAAPAWDDLWRRSEATLPTLQAELIAQWIEQFAPGAELHALAVESGGRWLAALPLVGRKVARVIDAAAMPLNEWSSSGDLLLDAAAGSQATVDVALDALVEAALSLRFQLLWLDDVAPALARWKAFADALRRAGAATDYREQLRIGRIEIDHDWPAYRMRWSRRHRQQMARHTRRLARRGPLRLRTLSRLEPRQVRRWMQRGFAIEDRSWKGEAGTSVLRTAGMFDFFARQAEQLAGCGQLELAFLECGRRPVAFAYGQDAKGVYHSIKVGYDPRYATYSPGQLLRYCMFRRFFGDPQRRAIDYMATSDAHRKWRPATYALGRLVIAPRRLGRLALGGYRQVWPGLRCLRDAWQR